MVAVGVVIEFFNTGDRSRAFAGAGEGEFRGGIKDGIGLDGSPADTRVADIEKASIIKGFQGGLSPDGR